MSYADEVVRMYELIKEGKESEPWQELPKGWTMKSVREFWNSLTGDREHKVTACMKKMEGKVDNPAAFCASLRDLVEGTTEWRGKK